MDNIGLKQVEETALRLMPSGIQEGMHTQAWQAMIHGLLGRYAVQIRAVGAERKYWIDLELVRTPEIWDVITTSILSEANATEWEVIDATIPQEITRMSIRDQLEYVRIANRFEGTTREAFEHFCARHGLVTAEQFEDKYLGQYKNQEQFCVLMLEDRDPPLARALEGTTLLDFVDWEGYWEREWGAKGYTFEHARNDKNEPCLLMFEPACFRSNRS